MIIVGKMIGGGYNLKNRLLDVGKVTLMWYNTKKLGVDDGYKAVT